MLCIEGGADALQRRFYFAMSACIHNKLHIQYNNVIGTKM
jgi:hypothetical protein